MKVKVAGEHIITLTEAISEYSPTADAQETDITCVADVNGSLIGKYFKLYAANNSSKYYVYYDVDSDAEVSTFTTIANSSRSLDGKYFYFYDVQGGMYVPWFNTGIQEVNTLTCGTAAQTDMTGAKEKNTITCGSAAQTDMTGAKEKNTLTCGTAAQTDMTGAKEKNTLTCGTAAQTDMTGAKEKNTLSCGTAAQTDMTGEKEKNTLSCGTAAQTDMTGAKEVNTVVAEADTGGSLNGECFHFWALDANNGTDNEYYVWFNVSSNGVDPAESGTGIEVAITMNDIADDVATAVRSAINASSADVTASGSGANIVITGDYWGESTAASDGTAGTGWSSFTRTTTGVDITAGEYFTIFAGLNGEEIQYVAWFNATGGSSSGEAPSFQPTVAGTDTYIQVDHAHDANADAMGLALRTALSAMGAVTISGATTDAIVENNEYGEGVAATESFSDVNFTVARTNTGVDKTAGEYFILYSGLNGSESKIVAWFNATGGSGDNEAPSTQPVVADTDLYIQVDHAYNANAEAMGLALRTALTNASLSGVTISGATTDAIVENDSWGEGVAATEHFTNVNFTVDRTVTGVDITAGEYFIFYAGSVLPTGKYYTWFNATGGSANGEAPSTDPAVSDATGIRVDHAYDATANEMATALKAAIDAEGISDINTGGAGGASANVTIENTVWGVGTPASEHFTDVAFQVAETVAGVDQTNGDYFTFYAGLSGSETEYYAWFNATGGGAAGEAPSLDPSASGTGIEIQHSYAANADQMGAAIRQALTNAGITGITIGGSTNTVTIENDEWGVGVAATENITNGAFSIARTVAGVDTTAGEYVTFYAGLNGSETEYYAWFNATGGSASGEAPSTDPGASGTGIRVDHTYNATNNEMATALKSAIDGASISGITTGGAGGGSNDVTIENDVWGEGVAATESVTNLAFSVARTVTGVDTTAGEYFIFYSGLNGDETKYYAWFNAIGGSASGEAPSTEPVVADATGIQVDHAYDANAEEMGLALRTALGTAAPSGVTISGATTDAIITNSLNGEGVAATEHFSNATFSVARTVTGYADSTRPTVNDDATYIEVDLSENDTDSEVGTAVRTALNGTSAVTSMFTISGSTTSVVITSDDTGPTKDSSEGTSGFTLSVTTQGVTDAGTNDPKVKGYTAAKVTIVKNNDGDTVAEKTKDVIHALSDFTATRSNEVVSVVNAANGECSDPSDGHPKSTYGTGFTFSVTTDGVTGIVAPTGQKLYKIVGTQPDLEFYGGAPIPGRTKSVTLVALEEEIEYIQEGF